MAEIMNTDKNVSQDKEDEGGDFTQVMQYCKCTVFREELSPRVSLAQKTQITEAVLAYQGISYHLCSHIVDQNQMKMWVSAYARADKETLSVPKIVSRGGFLLEMRLPDP